MREFELLFKPYSFDLKDFDIYKVSGEDRERFLNGQLTNDTRDLSENTFHLNARTTRTGQLVSYFYLAKLKDFFLFIVSKKVSSALIEDLQKFIIMDDVFIEKDEGVFSMLLSPTPSCEYLAEGEFLGRRAFLTNKDASDKSSLSPDEMNTLKTLSLWPDLGRSAWSNKLITDTFLTEKAISLKKGCFLGQETIAKVMTRRGAGYYPVLLELSIEDSFKDDEDIFFQEKKIGTILSSTTFFNKSYLQVHLFRDYRVENKELIFKYLEQEYQGKIKLKPLLSFDSLSSLAQSCYKFAVEDFNQGQEESALSKLELCLQIDPTFADAYESKGVILGRQERYQEAIAIMDKLQEVQPDSVMAHTNKSLFLMKLGKIEEAEEEKSKATLKSFEQNAKEADKKKQKEELAKKEIQELTKRKEMFAQVLEIDEKDVIANYGMGDILYKEKEYSRALEHLEVSLEEDEKHSLAYLLAGKCFFALGEKEKSKILWERGVQVASQRGDMMPANEMQSLLSKMTSTS